MEHIQDNDLGYAIGRTARILYRLLDGNLRSLVLSFSQVNVLGYLAAKHAPRGGVYPEAHRDGMLQHPVPPR